MRIVVLAACMVLVAASVLRAQEEAPAKERIAYIGEKGQVYTANEDGTDEKKLTSLPNSMYHALHVAADGSKIVIGTFHGIYILNADGSDVKQLKGEAMASNDKSPFLSPDGTKITFVSGDMFSTDIFVMNADGSGRTNLTKTEKTRESNPVWSPDGTKIAFVAEEEEAAEGGGKTLGPGELCVMNADGSNRLRLTNDDTKDYSPVWSPDSVQIAFTKEPKRVEGGVNILTYDIHVVGADGTGLKNLTEANTGEDKFPCWSPDGKTILFISRQAGGPNSVYTMNSEGGDLKAILEPAWGPEFSDPRYSPDGKKILVRDGYYDLYIMNADGSGKGKVAKGHHAAWLPRKK